MVFRVLNTKVLNTKCECTYMDTRLLCQANNCKEESLLHIHTHIHTNYNTYIHTYIYLSIYLSYGAFALDVKSTLNGQQLMLSECWRNIINFHNNQVQSPIWLACHQGIQHQSPLTPSVNTPLCFSRVYCGLEISLPFC